MDNLTLTTSSTNIALPADGSPINVPLYTGIPSGRNDGQVYLKFGNDDDPSTTDGSNNTFFSINGNFQWPGMMIFVNQDPDNETTVNTITVARNTNSFWNTSNKNVRVRLSDEGGYTDLVLTFNSPTSNPPVDDEDWRPSGPNRYNP
jgi:hypothetical protein